MNTNKILIASLVSLSLLFTGFTNKKPKPWRVNDYDDFTYEETFREERTGPEIPDYTYFEYSVTNTGEEYIDYIYQEGVGDFLASRVYTDSVVFQNQASILLPGTTGTFSCKAYGYSGEDVFLVAHTFNKLVEDVSYGELVLEDQSTKDYISPYRYYYTFSLDVSYAEKEDNDEPFHDYSYRSYAILKYKDNLYTFDCSKNTFEIHSKEEIDIEQLSINNVIVSEDIVVYDVVMPNCIREIDYIPLVVALGVTLIGLPLLGSLVPIVILIVNKSKKPKEKQS